MAISTVTENDSANTLRQRVNSVINAVNNGSGGGGSSEQATTDDRVLNILHIGNSHTEDAWAYVPYMLLEYGIKTRMMIFRKAGAGISGLNSYYDTPWSEYRNGQGNQLSNSEWGKIRFIDTSGESGSRYETWNDVLDARDGTTFASYNAEDYTTQDAVLWNDTRWDIVILQENYNDMASQMRTGYSSPIAIIKKIAADLSFTPLFGLQVVHTSSTYKDKGYMFGSLANHHNLYMSLPFDMLFPSGTAIANARQFQELKSVCSFDTLLADGIHLQEGLPCYISSLACMESLFRRFYPQFTVIGDTTRVTDAWKANKNIPATQGTTVVTSESNALLAQRIAALSNDHPWDITDSSAETISKKETVTVRRDLQDGLWVCGAVFNSHSTSTGSITVQKHSYLGGKVTVRDGYTGTLTSVVWTMGGESHECEIVNNEAYVLIKDICSEVVLTAIGENLTQTT